MRSFRPARVLYGVFVTALLAGAARLQAADTSAPGYELPRGPYRVSTTDVTLHDDVRGKDLEMRVRVPVAQGAGVGPTGKVPLVVFSHGAGGSRTAFGDLLDFWATHGIASVAMTHADSIELGRRNGETGPSVRTEEGRRKLLLSVDLGDRVNDCKFVIDALEPIAAAVGKAGGPRLDPDLDRLAVAGHSAGAYTAQLCAGVKVREAVLRQRGLAFTRVADDRFKAAIIISGQGLASLGLDKNSWSDVRIPMLVITGSEDHSPPGMGKEDPESRQDPYRLSRGTAAGGPPAYLLFITGATHGSYQGKATTLLLRESPGTDVRAIQKSVAAATTGFLDAHLRQHQASLELLRSQKLEETIPGKVRWESK